jgi:hypothetical protein
MPKDSLLRHIQVGVARLQAVWALRISISQGLASLRSTSRIKIVAVPIALVIALLTPSVLRNMIDYFVDLPVVAILRLVGGVNPRVHKTLQKIWYLGTIRALLEYRKSITHSRKKSRAATPSE